MANLNPWQKLSWIVPGMPFGTGLDGDQTFSSDPNSRATVTASSGSNTLSLGSAILNNGDCFLIIQIQGSGAGNWEFNKVISGGGTTTPTLKKNLQNSYTTGAQVVKFSLTRNATVNSFTLPNWNGSTGGVTVICARSSISLSGTVTIKGSGFRSTGYPIQGEGTPGAGGNSNSANGNGGGSSGDHAGGGGGGNANAGSNGVIGPNGSTSGQGGGSVGSSDLITIVFGGGGGSGNGVGAGNEDGATQTGGAGGGILILISKSITITGSVNGNGKYGSSSSGDSNDGGGSGGGAGGSVLIVCNTVTLGSSLITATGGAGGSAAAGNGGAGSVGRISVHHSGSVSGLTSPNYNDTFEATLQETGGAAALLGII